MYSNKAAALITRTCEPYLQRNQKNCKTDSTQNSDTIFKTPLQIPYRISPVHFRSTTISNFHQDLSFPVPIRSQIVHFLLLKLLLILFLLLILSVFSDCLKL